MSLSVVLENVVRAYLGEKVLGPFGYTFPAGSTTLIMGPNGCGKSTLLRICAMLESPDAGNVRFFDADKEVPQDLTLRRRVTLVFPKTTVFRGTVFDNIAYGLKVRKKESSFIVQRVEEVLNAVGLLHKIRQDARTLSSGESQRLGIARAIAIRPDVLFLDEPTASVDEEHTAFIEQLVLDLTRQTGTTIVMTTHDRHQAEKIGGQLIVMKRGVVVESLVVGEPLRTSV